MLIQVDCNPSTLILDVRGTDDEKRARTIAYLLAYEGHTDIDKAEFPPDDATLMEYTSILVPQVIELLPGNAKPGVLTVTQLKEVMKGQEPSAGGYSSTWTYKQHAEGVILGIEIEWIGSVDWPNPVLVVSVSEDGEPTIMYRKESPKYGVEWEAEIMTETIEQFAYDLASNH